MIWCRRDLHTLSIHYTLCTDEAAFHKELRHLKVKGDIEWLRNTHSEATTHRLVTPGPAGKPWQQKHICIVCLPAGPAAGKTLEQVHALLLHEAVHIWQWHCENIGEAEPSAEFEAYALQLIAQELFLRFKEFHYGRRTPSRPAIASVSTPARGREKRQQKQKQKSKPKPKRRRRRPQAEK